MIKGVLFDMDGLLLDTEKLGSELLPRVSAQHGYNFPIELYYRILGCNHLHSKQVVLEHFGAAYPYEEISREFFDQLLETARAGKLPIKKGLTECMEGLRSRGIQRALVTSTQHDVVTEYISHTPALQGIFNEMVCGTEVKRSKPEPDIYLEAAHRLSLFPDECIGVEDSRNGLRSITAAGCVSVMIPDLLAYDESFAGLVNHQLNDLTQLCALVDRLNSGARTRG